MKQGKLAYIVCVRGRGEGGEGEEEWKREGEEGSGGRGGREEGKERGEGRGRKGAMKIRAGQMKRRQNMPQQAAASILTYHCSQEERSTHGI